MISPSLAGAADAGASALRARVLTWDLSFKPATEELWVEALLAEVRAAADGGFDAALFPELLAWGLGPYAPKGERPAEFITRVWTTKVLPRAAKLLAKRPDALVVLGTYPHQEKSWGHAYNRAAVWRGGRWRFADKLDPTQPETLEDPRIKPGDSLPVWSFRGGKAVVLTCFSVEMPEVAAKLKAAGVQLVLVPSATSDARGVGRILRTASARAVELGAAVLVSPLTGEQDGWKNEGSPALFLPDQEGVSEAAQVSVYRRTGLHRVDFELPWSWLLSLRSQGAKPETRPFLSPNPGFELAVD